MSASRPGAPRLHSSIGAVRVVLRAGRASFLIAVGLFSVSSLGMVVLLLIGNALLRELIAGDGAGLGAPRLWVLAASAILVGGVVSFAGAAATGVHRVLVERVIRHYRDVLLRVAASVTLSEFDSPEFHDRLQRAKSNQMAPMMLAMAVPTLLGALVGMVGVAVGLAAVNVWLTLATLLAGVPLWYIGRRNGEKMYSFNFGDTPNDRARFNIEDIVDERRSAPEVRAFSLAPFLLDRWRRLYDERIAGISTLVRRFVARSAVASAVGSLVLAGVFAIVFALVRGGQLSVASAATASLAVLLLANRGQVAATNLAQMSEQSRYVDDLLALQDWAGSLRPGTPIDVEPFDTLAVEDVSFAYPGSNRDAIHAIATTIRAGEVIAIVGANGSGKTTLAKMLCGLYAPTAGTIRWDGRPLTEITDDGGLRCVGVVFQDFGRYWFTAAENVAIGATHRMRDRAAIEAAAVRAGAGGFLSALPQQFDTPLAVETEGGVDLSGGQWQRVAIARVLFRDAAFVILDEPTAALDAEAEAELFATIEELREGRTVVIISHRFSTVRSADRILVLDQGQLIEEGTHAQLMDRGGRYSRMYTVQADPYRDRADAQGR